MRVGEFASSHGPIVSHWRARRACRCGDCSGGYGHEVLSRWQGGLAAIVVTLLAAVLVVLDSAVQQLRTASIPLLQVLDPETQAAVRGDESA